MSDNQFIWPIRVYYEDTDVGGIVYHSNYLKYFERARSEWLRKLGYELDELAEDGLMFVVTHAELDFIVPAKFNEALEVHSTVTEFRGASFTFAQRLMRGELCLVRASVKAATVNSTTLRPTKMPRNLKQEMGFVS